MGFQCCRLHTGLGGLVVGWLHVVAQTVLLFPLSLDKTMMDPAREGLWEVFRVITSFKAFLFFFFKGISILYKRYRSNLFLEDFLMVYFTEL